MSKKSYNGNVCHSFQVSDLPCFEPAVRREAAGREHGHWTRMAIADLVLMVAAPTDPGVAPGRPIRHLGLVAVDRGPLGPLTLANVLHLGAIATAWFSGGGAIWVAPSPQTN